MARRKQNTRKRHKTAQDTNKKNRRRQKRQHYNCFRTNKIVSPTNQRQKKETDSRAAEEEFILVVFGAPSSCRSHPRCLGRPAPSIPRYFTALLQALEPRAPFSVQHHLVRPKLLRLLFFFSPPQTSFALCSFFLPSLFLSSVF